MSDVPLLGKNIGDNFDWTVAADPAREALVEVPTGQRWTFVPLRANVDALALGVLEVGVQKDDRAGIWALNMAEWTLPRNATDTTGASLVNINSSRCSRTTTSRTMCSSSRTS
jgi:fatty-acyl-CoA synthase